MYPTSSAAWATLAEGALARGAHDRGLRLRPHRLPPRARPAAPLGLEGHRPGAVVARPEPGFPARAAGPRPGRRPRSTRPPRPSASPPSSTTATRPWLSYSSASRRSAEVQLATQAGTGGRASIAAAIARFVQRVVDHLAGQVGAVGGQVEVAVPAQRGQDDLLLAGLATAQRLFDRRRPARASARAPARCPRCGRTAPRRRSTRAGPCATASISPWS